MSVLYLANAAIALTSIVLILFTAVDSFAAHAHPEKYYQVRWCSQHNGQAEVVLADKTRADCITETHAIEFDFGKKWAESVGQSLYYSLQTGKRAGIVLILESPADQKYWIRLNSTIQHFLLPIDTWQQKAKAANNNE